MQSSAKTTVPRTAQPYAIPWLALTNNPVLSMSDITSPSKIMATTIGTADSPTVNNTPALGQNVDTRTNSSPQHMITAHAVSKIATSDKRPRLRDETFCIISAVAFSVSRSASLKLEQVMLLSKPRHEPQMPIVRLVELEPDRSCDGNWDELDSRFVIACYTDLHSNQTMLCKSRTLAEKDIKSAMRDERGDGSAYKNISRHCVSLQIWFG